MPPTEPGFGTEVRSDWDGWKDLEIGVGGSTYGPRRFPSQVEV